MPKYELPIMKTAQIQIYPAPVQELNTEGASEISECALAPMRIHFHVYFCPVHCSFECEFRINIRMSFPKLCSMYVAEWIIYKTITIIIL